MPSSTNGSEPNAEASSSRYPAPTRGAALPLTFHPKGQRCMIVGSNKLAATRAFAFLEADAYPLVLTTVPLDQAHDEVRYRVEAGQIEYEQYDSEAELEDMVDAYLTEHGDICLVCVTDTMIGSNRRSVRSAQSISDTVRAHGVPINVADMPELSNYSFPSTHRFPGEAGPSPLQVAVSTNGRGCRLSGRIKRDIASKLHPSVGPAVENVGQLRARAKSKAQTHSAARLTDAVSTDDSSIPLNSPVPQLGSDPFETDDQEKQLRRMRWVHQMSEYYSYDALARLSASDMDNALETYSSRPATPGIFSPDEFLPHHEVHSTAVAATQRGRIYLVGSGPGHPGLLTVAAHHILRTATLILSDKLVPSEVLALIPKTTKLHIAKKFPGNAEGAQNEMMELALEGAKAGEVVVRLKQGDPFVYGRGGEEVLYFREHGFESVVIPGVSSALAGPLMMGIPVTQRGVAESLVLCTGVGRQGKAVQLPGYVKPRSLLVLMGVARIASIVEVLTSADAPGRDGAAYPRHLPIAVIERASSPDQRVILSTLDGIAEALRSVEERPPGMMLIGWAALALEGKGRVDVLDQGEDGEEGIVQEWLTGQRWKIREGLQREWEELLSVVEA